MSIAQRATVVLAAAGAAALVGAMSWYGGQPEWRTLTSGGDAKQVAEILTALDSQKISHRVEGMDVIQVPVDQLSTARTEVLKKGLNKNGVGFELLDKTNAFTTSMLELVNVRRAYMGELEQVLRSWPGVEDARVLIGDEKESWRGNEKVGTASVNLRMRAGFALTNADVAGVQSFVAGSWSTLKPDHVTVIVDGKKYTRDVAEGDQTIFVAANDQLSTQREYATFLSKSAQKALDAAFGPGKAIVTVHSELDFDSRLETTSIADGDAKLVLSDSKTNTKKSGARTAAGGAAGTSSNVPQNANPQSSDPNSLNESESSETTENKYEYPKTQRTTKKNGFNVKRVSVALLADSSLKDRMTELEGVVKAAVGFDVARNDVYSGSAAAEFPKNNVDATPLPAPVAGLDVPRLVTEGGRVVVLVLLVGLFLFIIKRSNSADAKAQRAAGAQLQPGGKAAPEGVGTVAVGGPAGTRSAAAAADLQSPDAALPEVSGRQTLMKSAAAAALRDPAVAGNVVRTWLEGQ